MKRISDSRSQISDLKYDCSGEFKSGIWDLRSPMDDFIIVIYLFFVLLVLVCAFLLPITALVISIRASQRVKRFSNVDRGAGDSLRTQLQNLEARLQRIET